MHRRNAKARLNDRSGCVYRLGTPSRRLLCSPDEVGRVKATNAADRSDRVERTAQTQWGRGPLGWSADKAGNRLLKWLAALRGQKIKGRCIQRPFRQFVPIYFGSTTVSITWITPLSATTSALITLAPLTVTPPVVARVSSPPCTVLTLPALTSLAITLPLTTW